MDFILPIEDIDEIMWWILLELGTEPGGICTNIYTTKNVWTSYHIHLPYLVGTSYRSEISVQISVMHELWVHCHTTLCSLFWPLPPLSIWTLISLLMRLPFATCRHPLLQRTGDMGALGASPNAIYGCQMAQRALLISIHITIMPRGTGLDQTAAVVDTVPV